ncbi:AlpA family transcriptional regulator [Vibrio fluvialis]|uniref:AlpA family transcriptional regulator n=1 Tax=Vibrio fluvialis TaxID=676 RepID=UPI001558628F|nr:AlpA family transcriptional regulator [Vibrio fluvialis]EKO3474538.1 AlpA family transcriptional regulator [Vibrio fluvialis]
MRILRLKDVMAMTGLSRATIYVYMAKQNFPQKIHLGSSSIGWLESEVQEWIAVRVEARDAALAMKAVC